MNWQDRIEMAKRLDLTVEQQVELSKDVDVGVRGCLAQNPSLVYELELRAAHKDGGECRGGTHFS